MALWVYHENSSFLPTSTNKKVLIVIKYLANKRFKIEKTVKKIEKSKEFAFLTNPKKIQEIKVVGNTNDVISNN